MSNRVRFDLDRSSGRLVLEVLDPKLRGHDAKVRVVQRFEVLKGNGVDVENELLDASVKLEAAHDWALDHNLEHSYSHEGKALKIEIVAHLHVDDGVIIDTRLSVPLVLAPPLRGNPEPGLEQAINPKDQWSWIQSFRAIDAKQRLHVVLLMVIGVPVMLFNLAVGWHDETVPESQAWFYDQSGYKDGRRTSESPFMKSLMGSGGLGAAIGGMILAALRSYAKIELRQPRRPLKRDTRIPARELVSGKARVPLRGARLRVVAFNVECGKTREKNKNKTVERHFEQPFRAVILFDHPLLPIPAQAEIADFVGNDPIDFGRMFSVLFPPQMQGTHGIELRWELQLLVPDLLDHEIKGAPLQLDPREFA